MASEARHELPPLSGIGGLFSRDGSPAQALPARMADALWRRGPDGARSRVDGMFMVRTLRCSTPEDAYDTQPLRGPSGAMIVADVRLDDREDLSAALGLRAIETGTLCDAALALLAYEKWGPEFVERLVGAFAIAVWEPRERRLLCARDPMGERPLHYSCDARRFAFASTAVALFAVGVPRHLNEAKVVDALARLPADASSSYYRHVYRLPPGHALVATLAGTRVWRYFDPRAIAVPPVASDEGCVEAARGLFEKAVRARLRSTRNVGVMMSGGLDSPAVAAVAAGLQAENGKRLAVFTALPRPGLAATWPGRFGDERPYVDAICAAVPGLDVTYVMPPAGRLFADLDGHHEQAEAPVLAPFNFLWAQAIAAAAREQDLGVILNGQLGNLTLSWRGKLPRRGRFQVWAASARGYVLRTLGVEMSRWLESTPLRAGVVRDFNLRERLAEAGVLPVPLATIDGRRERLSAVERSGTNTGIDSWEAMHDLERRDPTGDRRILELCLGLPRRAFSQGGRTRLLIRRMMEGRIPPLVLWNERRGWQSADWLVHLQEARPQLPGWIDRIATVPLVKALVDLPRLRKLLDPWRAPATPARERGRFSEYHSCLPRAITVGLFVEWLQRRP